MQRRSLEVLHHEVIGADVVQDADVRMAQRRNGSRFLQRALAVPGSERLDRHRSTQTGVDRLVHRAHSAFANLREDLIWAGPGTGSQSHLRGVDYSDNVIDAQRKDNALLRFLPRTRQHRVELTVHD